MERDRTEQDRIKQDRGKQSGSGFSVSGAIAVIGTIVMLPMAGLFLVVWLSGWQLGVVRTGSMDPAIPTGSMIVTSPISADEVEAGMVLEYVDPTDADRIITHRVVEVKREAGGEVRFVTKGDANPERDTAEVPAENVRAKVRWHITGIGSLMWKMRWPYSLAFVAVPLALVLVSAGIRGSRPGERRARVGPQVECETCSTPIDDDFRYCPHCGVRQAGVRQAGVRQAGVRQAGVRVAA